MVGVDNVCERSAVLGAMTENEPGKLILPKHAQNGMTAALAVEKIRLHF
jgi:cobalt-precorrin 5A hydrolase